MRIHVASSAENPGERSNQKALRLCAVAAATLIGVNLAGQMSAQASTLTLINNYAGADTRTAALGINNAGEITGEVTFADGSGQGFVRDTTGNYTLFSNTGASNFDTIGRSVSANGYVTGYSTDSAGDLTTDSEFIRAPNGAITQIVNPNTHAPISGIAQAMNASGAIVGDDFGDGPRFGFELNGSTFTDLDTQAGYRVIAARGINDAGDIVGWGTNLTTGDTQGYVDLAGVFHWFSDPSPAEAGDTAFEAINNNDIVAGTWYYNGGLGHAFEFNALTDVFTEIGVPAGQTFSESFGINDSNIAIVTTDTNNYLFNPAGVPEPASWATLLAGVFGLGGILRRRRAPVLTTA